MRETIRFLVQHSMVQVPWGATGGCWALGWLENGLEVSYGVDGYLKVIFWGIWGAYLSNDIIFGFVRK